MPGTGWERRHRRLDDETPVKMKSRIPASIVSLVVLTLASIACNNGQPPPTQPHTPEYLTEEIPPCTSFSGSPVDPCEPDVEIETRVPAGTGPGGIFNIDKPQTVREFLDGSSIGSVPHIVLRGTYVPGTVRCTSGNPFRMPPFIERDYSQELLFFLCFADVRVNGYILGIGPTQLTVQVISVPYVEDNFARAEAEEGMTGQELFELFVETTVIVLEEGYDRNGEGIYGREVVLFIGPGANYATEAWQVHETWDVQRREDGTIVAIQPRRDDWRGARPDDYQTYRSQLEMELPAFKQAVTTAHEARVAEYGGRIAPDDIQSRAKGVDLPMLITDANQLRQYFIDVGAYDHPDGPPAQPPPPAQSPP